MDNGTSGAAELFASALNGNQRADLVGEHTIGRAGVQKLVKLPGGSGLWLTTVRYLTPAGNPLHEKGLEPTVPVEGPEVEFGQPAPDGGHDAGQGDRAGPGSASPRRKESRLIYSSVCGVGA